MNAINRRQFLKFAGAAAALASLPRAVGATTTAPRILVIGGGFGGATAAKYVKMWGGNVAVTLVDANPNHLSCILSNLVVTNRIGMNRITLTYDSLRNNRGINVVQGRALSIDPVNQDVEVRTATDTVYLEYDHLVLSPGIDFIAPPGNYDVNRTPHAWQAGPQTTLLKSKLAAMPNGSVYVLAIPKAPYRCPPGPYERACVVADYLKQKKPRSKVIVLDGNADITAEPHTFHTAFDVTFKGRVEYKPNAVIKNVDSSTLSITTNLGTINRAGVLNIIPDQKAGKIVLDNGLATSVDGRWAPVNPLTYGTLAYPNIHVIGDSQATGQPKSGHMANAQAKVCADAIVRALNGEAPDPRPTTNSACYSPITSKTASWLSASFQYDPLSKSMVRVAESFGEADAPSGDNYEDMFQWADNIFADSFI